MNNNKCSKCTRFFVVNEKREVVEGITRHVICPSSTKPTTSSVVTTGLKEIISCGKTVGKKTVSLISDKTTKKVTEQEVNNCSHII